MSDPITEDATDQRPSTSPYEYFLRLARHNRPKHTFAGEVTSWQRAALPEVLATLGELPAEVDPNPELIAEYRDGDLICQRWRLDVADAMSVVLLVNRPAGLGETERAPAILCWHGHSAGGKEAIMGNDSSPILQQEIAQSGTDYGRRMAQAGFVTFAIDWMGRGDLDDAAKPHYHNMGRNRDWCNLYYVNATLLGMTSLGLNVTFGRRATDFVSHLPFVDPSRLGVMGLSGGGTMTLWTALTDQRFRAVEIICYSDLFADFGYRDLNYCGAQVTPGLFRLVDLPDLQGLLVPRPLLVDIGAYDECFRIESAMRCHERLREIYRAHGTPEALQLNLFPGGHSWPGPAASVPFFEANLGRPGSAGRQDT